MIDEGRFCELCLRQQEGSLDAADRDELALALAADPALQARFLDAQQAHVVVAAALAPRRAVPLADRVLNVLRASTGPRCRQVADAVLGRSRRPVAWWWPAVAAGLAAALVLGAVVLLRRPAAAPAPAPVASVAPASIGTATARTVQGVVEIEIDGVRRPLAANGRVPPGARLHLAAEASLDLAADDLADLLLTGPASGRLVPVAAGTLFALEGGRAEVSSRPRPAEAPLIITSTVAECRVLGTRFTVEDEPGLVTRVCVQEGRVRVLDRSLPAGETAEVQAGETVSIYDEKQLDGIVAALRTEGMHLDAAIWSAPAAGLSRYGTWINSLQGWKPAATAGRVAPRLLLAVSCPSMVKLHRQSLPVVLDRVGERLALRLESVLIPPRPDRTAPLRPLVSLGFDGVWHAETGLQELVGIGSGAPVELAIALRRRGLLADWYEVRQEAAGRVVQGLFLARPQATFLFLDPCGSAGWSLRIDAFRCVVDVPP